VWRHGLDIDPVDLHQPDSSRWLLACVWPDHPERRKRLEAAISLWKQNPPPLIRGDLVDDLSALIRQAPPDCELVILQSAVFPYVDMQRRVEFIQRLATESLKRDLTWVSLESFGVIPGLPTGSLKIDRSFHFLLVRQRFSAGRLNSVESLGLGHPHGWNLKWLAE